MDFVFWIIVIVLIVGVVWWLLNRSNTAKANGTAPDRAGGGLARGSSAASAEAAATAGIPGAAGFGKAAEPVPPTTADDAPTTAAAGGQGSTPSEASDQGEWETQWSEAAGAAPAAAHRPSAQEHAGAGATRLPESPQPGEEETSSVGYVHHPEYTGPHSPTLPGAETAAAEAGDEARQAAAPKAPATSAATPTRPETPTDAHMPGDLPENAPETETLDSARSSAAVETAASHTAEPMAAADVSEPGAEPAGHLAADQPYGAGSASPAPDGSGPEDFPVKGDAGEMVYYEEGHPDYEQTRAGVWFESAAHAEAAGFRAPRRKRL